MILVVFLVPLAFIARFFFVGVDSMINLSEISWMDWVYYTVFELLPILVLVIFTNTNIVKDDNVGGEHGENAGLLD